MCNSIIKPKCTIYKDWGGPSCGAPAISRNDWGGYQCKFHDSFARHPSNKVGPYRVLNSKTLLSRLALKIVYAIYVLGKQNQ